MRTMSHVTLIAALLLACKSSSSESSEQQAVRSKVADRTSAKPPIDPGRVLAGSEMPIGSTNTEAVTLYRAALDLRDKGQFDEASAVAAKALALDPAFVQAKALASHATPGPAGLAMLEQAVAEAASQPEPIKLELEKTLLFTKRETAKATEVAKRIVKLVPKDWRVHHQLGVLLFDEQHFVEAAAVFEKAIELNPKAGPAYNYLSTLYMDNLGKVEQASALLNKYVEVAPDDPFAYQWLGELQLFMGQLQEAETSFAKASEMGSSQVFSSLAYARFFQRDWDAGRNALARRRAAAATTQDRLSVDRAVFWSYLAQGKPADALASVSAYEQEAKNLGTPVISPTFLRAFVSFETGNPADAIKPLAAVLKRVDSDPAIDPDSKKRLETEARCWKVLAEARAGKLADARATLTALEGVVKGLPGNLRAGFWLALARGELALATKDAKAAAMHFENCSQSMWDEIGPYCQLRRIAALQQAGDQTAADAVTASVLHKLYPDGRYVYVWFKLGGTASKPLPAKPTDAEKQPG